MRERKLRQSCICVCILTFLHLQTSPCSGWERVAVKSPEIERKVYELCNQGDVQYNAQNYTGALELYKQASAFDPSSYSAYVHQNIGECLERMKQYETAVAEFKKSLNYDPKFYSSYYQLARTYYNWEHYDSATHYLRELMAITNDKRWQKESKDLLRDIETYGKARSGFNKMERGQYSQAKQLFLEAAKQDPSPVSANIHANLGWILRQTGKPEDAINEYKKSLQYDGNDKDSVFGLAISYEDIGQFDNAISWLQRYLQLETDTSKYNKVREQIQDLKDDKSKLNDSYNSLPDYLEHNMGDGDPPIRWSQKKLPIRVHVSDGKGVKGYKPSYPSLIKKSLDTWCNASGNKLAYQNVSDKKQADIEVVWIDKPILLEEKKRKRIKQGIAHRESDNNNIINHVLVEVDTMNSYEPSKELEESETASVCMHEIGHALGLEHSTNYSDVMFYKGSTKQTGLPTGRDKATIAKLYIKYPVSKSAPPPPTEEVAVRYLPPPSFMPPAPPSDKDLRPPMFLPPPILEENEKLTPPFFKPAPIQNNDSSAETHPAKKVPLPPSFLPEPLKPEKLEKVKKKTSEDPLFFKPAPLK